MTSPVPIASTQRRAPRLRRRIVADSAGLGSFAQRVLRERNLYGALAFAETAESLRICQHALQVGPSDRVAGICSSGDVLLSLLSEGPEQVAGFDSNPTQVALSEFKRAAMSHLTVREYLELFGVASASAEWRLRTFDRLTRATPSSTRRLLLDRRAWVPRGVLNHGMTHLIIRAIVTTLRRIVDAQTYSLLLGEHGSDMERSQCLDRIIQQPAARLGLAPFARLFASQLKWLFFPHKLCRVSSRPDEMVADFFETFRPLFERGAKNNPVLARSVAGHVHSEWTEHLYDAQRFERIRTHCSRLSLQTSDLTDGLRTLPDGWATRLYLSNAPDYLTEAELSDLVHEVRRVSAPGARILHFSLLDTDRLGSQIGAPARELEALAASDNVHLYPMIGLRIFSS